MGVQQHHHHSEKRSAPTTASTMPSYTDACSFMAMPGVRSLHCQLTFIAVLQIIVGFMFFGLFYGFLNAIFCICAVSGSRHGKRTFIRPHATYSACVSWLFVLLALFFLITGLVALHHAHKLDDTSVQAVSTTPDSGNDAPEGAYMPEGGDTVNVSQRAAWARMLSEHSVPKQSVEQMLPFLTKTHVKAAPTHKNLRHSPSWGPLGVIHKMPLAPEPSSDGENDGPDGQAPTDPQPSDECPSGDFDQNGNCVPHSWKELWNNRPYLRMFARQLLLLVPLQAMLALIYYTAFRISSTIHKLMVQHNVLPAKAIARLHQQHGQPLPSQEQQAPSVYPQYVPVPVTNADGTTQYVPMMVMEGSVHNV